MVHGLLGFAPALAAADSSDQQQHQENTGNRRENPLGSVGQRFSLAQPFRFGLIGGQRFFFGLGRRHLRRGRRCRGLLHVVDHYVITFKLQHLLQLILAGSGKPEGTGGHIGSQVGIHVPDKGSALSGGNAVKTVEGDITGLHGDVLNLHGAVIMNGNGEANCAGALVDHVTVRSCFHPQGDHLCRIHGGNLNAAGCRFNTLAGAFIRRYGELQFLGFSNSQVLLQHEFLAGFHFLAFEHNAQGRILYGNVGKVQRAGVLQRQGQLDGITGRSALLVRLQRSAEFHFPVFDRGAFNLLGVAFSAGLEGDGCRAGNVLRAHGGGEGIAFRRAHSNGSDGSGLSGNSSVLLDVHGGNFHVTGVGYFIGNADFLSLLGRGGGNRPLDGNLRIGTEIRHVFGEIQLMSLQRGFSVIADRAVIGGVPDREGHLAGIQLLLGHIPVAGPALAFPDGKRRGAEVLDLAAVRIVQRNRGGQIPVPDISYRDGNSDCFRSG